MKQSVKEYNAPQQEVIAIRYQSTLLQVSGVLDDEEPGGPAKSHEFDFLDDDISFEEQATFLSFDE